MAARSPDLAERVEAALGRAPVAIERLGGGSVGDVRRLRMADGSLLVAKVAAPDDASLTTEAWMLAYLAQYSTLPVPAVLHAGAGLLVMDYIDAPDALDAAAETHAAELVAALHAVRAPRHGLERDTVIGGLPQPNAESASWVDFFRDRRLLHMASQALMAGRLPAPAMRRIETLAGKLGDMIGDVPPALLHGDLWTGNVLVRAGRIVGFVDPAIYYGDAEMDLAFATLFGTFNAPFFRRYAEVGTLRPGFFEQRRDLYNLYPLLVHVRLFGSGYVGSVEAILSRLGV